MYTILVCDDERDIVSALTIYLTAEGYEVLPAYDGAEALEILAAHTVHLVLMDVMMPTLDGLTAMARLRETHNLPVILLTAKSEDSDKVLGLNVGADDYVTKPFNPVELLARVKSHLRRYTTLGACPVTDHTLQVGSLVLDTEARQVWMDGEEIVLTGTEYKLLQLFIKHPGKVFSTKEIYRAVWECEPYSEENTIAVHIRHLREKIEINPAEPRYLKVVWGQGYKLENHRDERR